MEICSLLCFYPYMHCKSISTELGESFFKYLLVRVLELFILRPKYCIMFGVKGEKEC